ncbi:MAG: 2,3-bisphosphoglycerate-independent phosphoglycerate mutase, partial [Deltaproteobacteria bacterium]|nr:2,3-bisphosphoglycerate-independent phosphoglycerate mutase [Deltaproteobacteria bacterium]
GPRPAVLFAGMMQYDGDTLLPKRFLVSPPAIDRTLGELLARGKVPQLAISETQKYGHVTYFWNGNRGGKFDEDRETYVCIPSDQLPFDERPWMKAAEVTDAFVAAARSGKYRHLRLNYPNGDMVGHTGVLWAAVLAVEAVDLSVARLVALARELQGVLIVTADHGNADEMYERDKKTGGFELDAQGRPKPKTAHTLNPVPFLIFDPGLSGEYRLSDVQGAGLSNVAATLLCLMGYEPPEGYDPPLIAFGR